MSHARRLTAWTPVFCEQVHFFDLESRVEKIKVMLNQSGKVSKSKFLSHSSLDDDMGGHDGLVRS
jgi:hypothetical protein